MEPVEKLISYFYTDPRLERLFGFIEGFEAAAGKENWGAYPPLAGFFAVVFSSHPDQIERLLPARLDPKSATAVATALRLSGKEHLIPKFRRRFRAGWDQKLQTEFANLPTRLDEIYIKTPTHLDILWGAAFASGDSRHVSMIVHFMASVVNCSEQIALDVFKMAAARSAGPIGIEILKEVRDRYGAAQAWEMLVASIALWALRSNALQHPFVEHVLGEYAGSHAGTPAAIALSNLRPKSK